MNKNNKAKTLQYRIEIHEFTEVDRAGNKRTYMSYLPQVKIWFFWRSIHYVPLGMCYRTTLFETSDMYFSTRKEAEETIELYKEWREAQVVKQEFGRSWIYM